MIHTVSSVSEFRSCKRRYRYKYVDLVRPASPGKARAVGSAIHVGLEAFDNGTHLPDAIDLVGETATDPFWTTDKGRVELARIVAILCAYWDQWSQTRRLYEPVEVEGEFLIEIGDSSFAGKRDSVWRLKSTGQLYVVERKTTSDDISTVGADYWQRLAIDLQVTAYQHALERETGESVGILYDVIRKPLGNPRMKMGVARRKNESEEEFEARKDEVREDLAEFSVRLADTMRQEPGKYLVRREVHRTTEQNRAILEELEETLREMDGYSGRYPRNDRYCQTKFGTCPYLSVCVGVETLDSENFTKAEGPHVELDAAIQENNYGEYSNCPI